MQTNIHPSLAGKAEIQEADAILRNCVHCGFCTATCPTYQLTGDELDGPRGRIYLIKNLLEDAEISDDATFHLDRCLTCRSCETTCPSGVDYGRLLEIGRDEIATRTERPVRHRLLTRLLRLAVPRHGLFGLAIRIGQVMRPVLPLTLRQLLFPRPAVVPAARSEPGASVLLLQGCAQQAATPGVVDALGHLLSQHGIQSKRLPQESCCGAVDLHSSASAAAFNRMEKLMDQVEAADCDTVVSSASGCGVTIKEYPKTLAYRSSAGRAADLAAKCVDVTELLGNLPLRCENLKVAVHTPCTLQHGQGIVGAIEDILTRAGATIVPAGEAHLCCGSAGTYSVLQPDLSTQLRNRKLGHLMAGRPDVIVTANVGCQMHLGAAADIPVMHWVEFLYHHARV